MKKLIVLVAILLITIASIFVYFRKPNRQTMDSASVEQAVRAAAILENNQFDEAIQLYQKLIQNNPSNSIAKKNLAVALIGKLKEQIEFLSDYKKDPNEIRKGLPEIIDAARAQIDEAMEVRKDDSACYQLDVELDVARISLLDVLIADEDQIELAEKLKRYVAKFPTDAFIVTRLFNQVDSIRNTAPQYLDDVTEPLITACKAHPRNLFLLKTLLAHLATRKDARAFDFVDVFVDLMKPFRWQFTSANARTGFEELVSIRETLKRDPDAAYSLLQSWTNEANATTGSKADLRLCQPNVLALIDMSDVEEALANIPRPASTSDPVFEWNKSQTAATGVIAFDWNVDTIQEVVTWQGSTLTLSSLDAKDPSQYTKLATLELENAIRGVVPVDLFEVKSGTRSKPVEVVSADASKMSPEAIAAALKARTRHDTLRDLVVFGDQGINVVKFATPPTPSSPPDWSLVSSDIGLADLKDVQAVLPIDWDADSDIDLVIIAKGNKLLLRQNKGNRTFQDVDAESLLPSDDVRVLCGVVVDFDRDVDLDVVCSCAGKVGVLENILHGQFRFRELEGKWQSLANATSIATGEVDSNHSWDYVAQTASGTVLLTTSTVPSQSVTPKLVKSFPGKEGWVVLQDWNNDGLIDAMSASKEEGVSTLVNSEGSLANKAKLSGADFASCKPATMDFNQDGLVDFLTIVEGSVAVGINSTKPKGNYAEIRVSGVSDEGGGGRINHFCVGSLVEIFSPAGYQARIIEDDAVHFGLRDSSPYNLRVVFPNGLTQNAVNPPMNQLVEEIQIPKGSCPFLYGWDGEKWALVTDLLWNAPLGLQYAKGKPIQDRRWEYLLLDGSSVQAKNGSYELRVTEELWETAYFDQIQLSYVDHPAGVEVHSNEKVGPPDIAKPGVWVANHPVPLRRAHDKYDRDWTMALQNRDRNFAEPFAKRICQGLVEEHWTELDFGPLDLSKPIQLYLTGWIYPTDTSINIGIDQNPEIDGPVPPSLWTVGQDGNFRNAIPFTGFPGGKPKTIVIPLDSVFATDDHRIRIQHTSEIYWDQAFVAYGEFQPLESAVTMLPLQSAELRYRGFSKERLGQRRDPHWYDYNQVSQEPNWPPMLGRFTRYGDVLGILERDDDHLVVMGAGDEVLLRFAAPETPVKPGWVRDLVMHNVGWDKDADLNTLEGQSSLPLPFSRMESYPPPTSQKSEVDRVDRLHADTLTREQQILRFWRGNTNTSVN
jgi:hypothetical protein